MFVSKVCSMKNHFGAETKLPFIKNRIQNRDYAKAFYSMLNGTYSLVPLDIHLFSTVPHPRYKTGSGNLTYYNNFQSNSKGYKYTAMEIGGKVGTKGTWVEVKATDIVYIICQQDCSSKGKVGFVCLKIFVNHTSNLSQTDELTRNREIIW